jgi:uncharacterized membrane protein YfhO
MDAHPHQKKRFKKFIKIIFMVIGILIGLIFLIYFLPSIFGLFTKDIAPPNVDDLKLKVIPIP